MVAAVVIVSFAVGVGVVNAVTQRSLPWWTGKGDSTFVFESDAGSLRYQVHLPATPRGHAGPPVVMALHGCGMTGYGWNSMKATTQLNELADDKGFIAVYPTQGFLADRLNCWKSGDPREQHRGAGEPALLAGIAREVVSRYGADRNQVHVAGASSGAGTAVILAVTYPDIFATVTSVAGGEYGLNQVDPDHPERMPPQDTARQAWAQMGSRARQVPLLVVQGDKDEIVPPLAATRLVQQFVSIADIIDDGRINDTINQSSRYHDVPADHGRHAYRSTVVKAANGSTIAESYTVEGMGHAWPGPHASGIFTDRQGPDASALLWDFAQRHPMPNSQ